MNVLTVCTPFSTADCAASNSAVAAAICFALPEAVAVFTFSSALRSRLTALYAALNAAAFAGTLFGTKLNISCGRSSISDCVLSTTATEARAVLMLSGVIAGAAILGLSGPR